VQGVHFRLDWTEPEDAGWKAVSAALSDLAASRARPSGALVSLSIAAHDLDPGGMADRYMAGVRQACDAFSCPVIGGDLVRTEGPTQLAVTVIGRGLGAPLLRSGASPGELLQVSGPTGWAALAVRQLNLGEAVVPPRAMAAHARPRARLDLLSALAPATAAIDISDGLLADAAHLSAASGVQLWLDRAACIDGGPEAELSLGGGEDYELLVTAQEPLPGFRTVGVVRAGEPALLWSDGTPVPLHGRGWDHGRNA